MSIRTFFSFFDSIKLLSRFPFVSLSLSVLETYFAGSKKCCIWFFTNKRQKWPTTGKDDKTNYQRSTSFRIDLWVFRVCVCLRDYLLFSRLVTSNKWSFFCWRNHFSVYQCSVALYQHRTDFKWNESMKLFIFASDGITQSSSFQHTHTHTLLHPWRKIRLRIIVSRCTYKISCVRRKNHQTTNSVYFMLFSRNIREKKKCSSRKFFWDVLWLVTL